MPDRSLNIHEDFNVSRETIQKLEAYQNLLLKWQKTINLISSQTINESWERHFLDSLQWINVIPKKTKTLIDMGSGAGFPGLVWAICLPEIEVHLVESDTRKCSFLRNVKTALDVKNVIIHNERIENAYLPCADIVSARALASLQDLLGYAENLITTNGLCLFPKGRGHEQEISSLKSQFPERYAKLNIDHYQSHIDPESVLLVISLK